MYIPSQIDIEYLIDAAEKTFRVEGIPEYIPYILFKEAQKTLLLFGSAENTAYLKDRIDNGLTRFRVDQECPEDYKENESIIKVLVPFYLDYNEKWGTSSANFRELEGSSETREKILTTSKALRTALKMLTRVERGDTSEEDFIREKGILEEFLQDTEYDGRTNWLPIEANMDVPISKIDIEYLIVAAEKTSEDKDIPKYFPYILFEEAQETLERFKKYQTSLFGPAENTADLEIKLSLGLSSITDNGNYYPVLPEDYGENESIIKVLVQFYRKYNEDNKIDEIREEDEKHKKWGILGPNFQELEGRSAMRERILTTSKALRTALKMLSRVEREDTPENEIQEEVEKAIASLKLDIEAESSPTRGRDVLDCLQKFFGFQESSVSNQRENIVNLLSNEQMRLGKHETVFNEALEKVFLKTLDNYIKWCSYLRIEPIWKNMDDVISKEKQILYISLYYLIWGEAANVRFLPECLCYIFHHMSKRLDDEYFMLMSEQLDVQHVSGSFIDHVIQPLYEVIAAEAKINRERDASHSKWRNYDDFNEYFWSRDCLQLGWPLERDSPFFQKPKKGSTVYGKTSFVEHRTIWHLYHSFHRMWIFHVMMFQALVIFAFNDGKLNAKTLREILSVGSTYFLMKLIQSMLDIVLKYGAYSKTGRVDVLRILFRFIWFMLATLFICFLCMKCLQEKTSSVEESIVFKVYIAVLVILFSVEESIVFKRCEKSFVAHLIKWINQEYVGRGMDEELLDSYLKEEYVGRVMDEKLTDYIKYMIFWLVTLGINFAYTYYYLISRLEHGCCK